MDFNGKCLKNILNKDHGYRSNKSIITIKEGSHTKINKLKLIKKRSRKSKNYCKKSIL